MARSWHSHGPEPNTVFGSTIGGNMPRFPMKLTASAIGSLALVFAAACQQRSESTPPEQTNSPGTTSTPGTTMPSSSSRTNPSSQDPNGMNSNPSATRATPSGSSISENDTQPVKGSDTEPMGAGGAGTGGAGHGGH